MSNKIGKYKIHRGVLFPILRYFRERYDLSFSFSDEENAFVCDKYYRSYSYGASFCIGISKLDCVFFTTRVYSSNDYFISNMIKNDNKSLFEFVNGWNSTNGLLLPVHLDEDDLGLYLYQGFLVSFGVSEDYLKYSLEMCLVHSIEFLEEYYPKCEEKFVEKLQESENEIEFTK
ncbi:hypothetical protein BKK51_12875 [Rodentibacter trehalosifermentans]|uniref:Uncharacterized protein n=1 Tax=Rodentibacter trehalosifermentans TaxID=1908263 RepID=A0A1V3J7C5_9PAST|nr:hypothetical protein [Rodentibacter trehalosifermentans]OOF42403.1 hypothetical protein BKK51_12875 [Rodentibacter trehalosifermentans]OOF50829.1 hypothetical protein BKK52_01405 [Rodentibacter trehalosifermentans]